MSAADPAQELPSSERGKGRKSTGRALMVFLFGGVIGTGFGVALGFILFPFVFPPPPAMEQLTEADRSTLIATGHFIHADPSDPIHYGSGKVSVYDGTVFLEENFEVGARAEVSRLSRGPRRTSGIRKM